MLIYIISLYIKNHVFSISKHFAIAYRILSGIITKKVVEKNRAMHNQMKIADKTQNQM